MKILITMNDIYLLNMVVRVRNSRVVVFKWSGDDLTYNYSI